jgi:glycosyltransferase involved in cell wall biosynthesis
MRPTLLFRGPVKTRSGYGAHARDLLQALYELELFDIKIDSCMWGNTPMTALDEDNIYHKWIESNIVTNINEVPDIYIQVTVPNEFMRVGKFNIGVTAGIETTIASKEWVYFFNNMDKIINKSNFSMEVLLQTVYNETEKLTGKLVKQYRIERPLDVLFEGVDLNVYNNQYDGFELDIKEDFAYLFVGHWLRGDIGHDRKDVGMLIKCFSEAFKDAENPPALILKTSSAGFSVSERESFRKRIQSIASAKNASIYLLFGDLTDSEMNGLYNHPKIKSMVTLTKGEGFGRPLLEFSMTGKPIIASNWSGHKDFLPTDKAIMLGGSLVNVHKSAADKYLLENSKWFSANYNEASEVMKLVYKDYDTFLEKSETLRIENTNKFSFQKMKEKLKDILSPFVSTPQKKEMILPKLQKIK